MRGSLWGALVVLAAVGVVGVACSSDGGQGPQDGVVEIELEGSRFSRSTVTIDPGTTVRWIANDTPHSITPDDPDQPGVWQAVSVTQTGVALEHTFNTPGETYDYHCVPHLANGMTGTIIVRSE